MTLDQIETFLTVAEVGSFKAAAEVLHRSQPALSVAVKKLEEELGIQLFSREQYRPELTIEGKAFFRRAQDLFHRSQSLERFGRQLGLGEEPEISVAIDGLCPLQYVLNGLGEFSSEYPDTRLNIEFEILGGAAEKVDDGFVQLAISPNIGAEGKKLNLEPVGIVNMIPVICHSLPKRFQSSEINSEVLKEMPQIIVRDSSTRPSKRSHGVLEGARQWSVKDMATKKDIILAGLGWGRMPEHMIAEELQRGLLQEITLNEMKRETVELCLMKSDIHPMGPLSQKLWDILLSSRF